MDVSLPGKHGLSNVLFDLEIRPYVPPDFHYLLSLQLLINQAVLTTTYIQLATWNTAV